MPREEIWRLSREHAEKAKYAFAFIKVYQGSLRDDRWITVSKDTESIGKKGRVSKKVLPTGSPRWRSEFIGKIGTGGYPKEIRRPAVYLYAPSRIPFAILIVY